MEIRNATIESADLYIYNGFALCINITLDYGDGSHQGFGGHVLFHNDRREKDFTGLTVFQVLAVCGVENWNQVIGKNIRVQADDFHSCQPKLISIGHITQDTWFEPQKEYTIK